MPPDRRFNPDKDKDIPGVNYDADERWRQKPLTPAQLLVNDVRVDTLRPDRGAMLEMFERVPSGIVPETAAYTPSASFVRIASTTANPIEKQRLTNLEEDFGWMRHLRLEDYQHGTQNLNNSTKCRWIHCSSKFPEYLRGFLWALSDDLSNVTDSMRLLDLAMERQTRFSKHGKYFAPFSQTLRPPSLDEGNDVDNIYPMLISVPFLDWTIQGRTPPLRFQVDRREPFLSARSSAHVVRSILQHFYRLEDTTDREDSQVFSKHKPWSTNRELDLKVRQWYGHHPSGLNVDELWILAIDADHIVTFSSNQSWKSRWPPLQLASRISDVSFRGIRNNFFRSYETTTYTAMTHAIASLSGAVGMLHRNFWPDMILCLSDRYSGHLGNLQYRLHRAPSTKLVMDLIACQEELNIVIQITEQQIDMISELHSTIDAMNPKQDHDAASIISRKAMSVHHGEITDREARRLISRRSTFRQLSSSLLPDPMAQLIDNLERELIDLRDLRDNTDRLVNRTIQLVNIRLEDHGKAILVFTVVTIVFLPLNFVSSYFGINTKDIRDMEYNQWIFWVVAISVTACVVGSAVLLAFSGGDILERLHLWRDRRKDDARRQVQMSSTTVIRDRSEGFQVHGGYGNR
jgi:Mg2+ and Co2+ transporter CorA